MEQIMTATAAPVQEKRRSRSAQQTATPDTYAEQPSPTPASAGSGDGRDANGRFTKGNAGGPGNPYARQTARIRSALIERVSEEDMIVIADALVLRARNGELAAIKLLFQYVIGKPTAAVNPDTVDIEEFNQIYVPQKKMLGEFQEAMNTLPPKLLTELVRVFNDLCVTQLSKVLKEPHEKLAETAQNLASYFPWMAPKTAPAPERDPTYDLVYGDDDADDTDEELDDIEEPHVAAPSTNRVATAPGPVPPPTTNGERTAPNGVDRPDRRIATGPAQATRRSHDNGHAARPRPSTNGDNQPGAAPPKPNGGNGRHKKHRRGG
jgi:hypothetical protein